MRNYTENFISIFFYQKKIFYGCKKKKKKKGHEERGNPKMACFYYNLYAKL